MFKILFVIGNLLTLFAAVSILARPIPFEYLGLWMMLCVLIGYVGRLVILDTADYLFPHILEQGESRWPSIAVTFASMVLGIMGFFLLFVPFIGLFFLLCLWSHPMRNWYRFKKEYSSAYEAGDLCDSSPISIKDVVQDLEAGDLVIYKEELYEFMEYRDYGFNCILWREGKGAFLVFGHEVKRPDTTHPPIVKEIVAEFSKLIEDENVLRCCYDIPIKGRLYIHIWIEMEDNDDDLVTNLEGIRDMINENFNDSGYPVFIEYFNKSYQMKIFTEKTPIPLKKTTN